MNARDDHQSTPAHKAAGYGQGDALKWLLENGADGMGQIRLIKFKVSDSINYTITPQRLDDNRQQISTINRQFS